MLCFWCSLGGTYTANSGPIYSQHFGAQPRAEGTAFFPAYATHTAYAAPYTHPAPYTPAPSAVFPPRLTGAEGNSPYTPTPGIPR
jgi:hypothetical protein